MIETILSIAQNGLDGSSPEIDRHAAVPTTTPLGRLTTARIALRAIVGYIERSQSEEEQPLASYHGVPLEALSDHELSGAVVPCEIEP